MSSDQTARANPSYVSDASGSSSSSEKETPDGDPRSRSRATDPNKVGPRPDSFGWQEIDLEPNRHRIDPNFTVWNSTSAQNIDFVEIKSPMDYSSLFFDEKLMNTLGQFRM